MFEWNDAYEIGVISIDNAHREIFRLAGEISFGERMADPEAFQRALLFLKDYVVRHFEDEEKYMRQIRHPDLAAHVEQHRRFRVHTVPEMEKRLAERNYDEASRREFHSMLCAWLSDHVMVFDQAIGKSQE